MTASRELNFIVERCDCGVYKIRSWRLRELGCWYFSSKSNAPFIRYSKSMDGRVDLNLDMQLRRRLSQDQVTSFSACTAYAGLPRPVQLAVEQGEAFKHVFESWKLTVKSTLNVMNVMWNVESLYIHRSFESKRQDPRWIDANIIITRSHYFPLSLGGLLHFSSSSKHGVRLLRRSLCVIDQLNDPRGAHQR